MSQATIMRSELIAAVDEAIEEIKLSGDVALYLREMAQTATEVLTGSFWDPRAECGCIIGQARIRRGFDPHDHNADHLNGSHGVVFDTQIEERIAGPRSSAAIVLDDTSYPNEEN